MGRADVGIGPYGSITRGAAKRAVEDAGPYDILLSPLQRVGNVTMVFGKGKGKRWKGGGGRGILTVLGDGAMGRRLPKEKEVML